MSVTSNSQLRPLSQSATPSRMSYSKEMQAALSRTKKLKVGDGTMSEAVLPLDQAVLNTLEETCHVPFAGRAQNPFNVNFGMFHMLAKRFRIPGATITMGNVAVNGEMKLPITPPMFKKMIEDESGEDNMTTYHIWTTLPGGYVLDHVMPSLLHEQGLIEVNDAVPAERFLYGLADEMPHNITYHPMLTGLEFFVASGTIDPEAMAYLMGERFAKQYD